MAIKEKGLVSFTSPRSIISEQYRTVRTNLFYSSSELRYRTLMITSTDFGEGKTTTAANLAISITYQGASVLIIDANLRNPSLHTIFSVDNNLGLANILTGEQLTENVIKRTEIDNLAVITSGAVTSNPADLFTTPDLDQLIEIAQKSYDVIVFDTPPVSKVADGLILANKCDGTILVIANEKTKKEDVVETKRQLELAKANCIGAIFNNK